MLDLARGTAGDKFTSSLNHLLLKLLLLGLFKIYSCSNVIITYSVAFSAINMHIYHEVS